MDHLGNRGTAAAYKQIRRIQELLPNEALGFRLKATEELVRRNAWHPLSSSAFLALTETSSQFHDHACGSDVAKLEGSDSGNASSNEGSDPIKAHGKPSGEPEPAREDATAGVAGDAPRKPVQSESDNGVSQGPIADSARVVRKRGRPAEISIALKEAALAVRARSGTWKEAAKVLYKTPYPTGQQVKNAPNVLKNYQKTADRSLNKF
jgi:hypothetical protein